MFATTSVFDENVERIVSRVRQGRLAFIALHSARWARPFVRLMRQRAKDDALAQMDVMFLRKQHPLREGGFA